MAEAHHTAGVFDTLAQHTRKYVNPTSQALRTSFSVIAHVIDSLQVQ